MNTFDRALIYLRSVDLSDVDIFEQPMSIGGGYSTAEDAENGTNELPENELPQWRKNLIRVQDAYLADPNNNVSNEYYKSVVLHCALCHLLDKQNGRVSCWDIACKIVRDNNSFKLFKKKWKNTEYPAVMMLAWDDYCRLMNPKPFYIDYQRGDQMNIELFMTAYEYVNNPNS